MRWSDLKAESSVKALAWLKEKVANASASKKEEVKQWLETSHFAIVTPENYTRRNIASGMGLSRATVDSMVTGRLGWPARWLSRNGPVTAGQRRRRKSSSAEQEEENAIDFQKVAPYRCPNGHGLVTTDPCVHCMAVAMMGTPPPEEEER